MNTPQGLKEPEKLRFIQAPISLMKGMLTNRHECINEIFNYGIPAFAKLIRYDLSAVAKQLIYEYYRGDPGAALTKMTTKYVEAGKIDLDEDYNGFHNKTFEPENEMESILKLFHSDIRFKELAVELYQYKQAVSILGLKIENIGKFVMQVEKKNLSFTGEPMAMFNIKVLFDYRDNEKDEFEVVQLLAYSAINSILGKKKYVKTNKQMILARMLGFSNSKALNSKLSEQQQSIYEKYSIRYWFDKLKNALELNWHVRTYSNNMRGLHITTNSKMTIQELADIAEGKKAKAKKIADDRRSARDFAVDKYKIDRQSHDSNLYQYGRIIDLIRVPQMIN